MQSDAVDTNIKLLKCVGQPKDTGKLTNFTLKRKIFWFVFL